MSTSNDKYHHTSYECALVHDYQVVNPSPDEITGMAIVKRVMRGSLPRAHVVPLNDILCAVHLIPVFSQLGTKKIPKKYKHELTLDDSQLFKSFYVNKFIDHHVFEILSWLEHLATIHSDYILVSPAALYLVRISTVPYKVYTCIPQGIRWLQYDTSGLV